MATLAKYAPKGVQTPLPERIHTYLEAASQTFKAGDEVTLSSGKVAIAKAAGSDLGANDKVLGRALQDATGTTDTPISVQVFKAGEEVTYVMFHATPASAATATTDQGTAYGLRNDTTGGMVVNKADTTNTKGVVVRIQPSYPVGEQYGTVTFAYAAAALVSP